MTNDMFYGELDAGNGTRGGQQKRYKEEVKVTLKSCCIPHNTWEATKIDFVHATLLYVPRCCTCHVVVHAMLLYMPHRSMILQSEEVRRLEGEETELKC